PTAASTRRAPPPPPTPARRPRATRQQTTVSEARRDPPELSYEEAREELGEVGRPLEQGGTTLEETLARWERGEALAQARAAWRHGARKRLDAAIDASDAADADD